MPLSATAAARLRFQKRRNISEPVTNRRSVDPPERAADIQPPSFRSPSRCRGPPPEGDGLAEGMCAGADRRYQLALRSTSSTASGCLAMTASSTRVGASGCDLPCSQFLSVVGGKPNLVANCAWLSFIFVRTSRTSTSGTCTSVTRTRSFSPRVHAIACTSPSMMRAGGRPLLLHAHRLLHCSLGLRLRNHSRLLFLRPIRRRQARNQMLHAITFRLAQVRFLVLRVCCRQEHRQALAVVAVDHSRAAALALS